MEVHLEKPDGSVGYEYRVGLNGLNYKSGLTMLIKIEPDLADEARKAAVDDGEATNEEIRTWTHKFIETPRVTETIFD
jgi:hypothetical protein